MSELAIREVIVGIIIGVAVTLLVSYFVGFQRELGKERAVRRVDRRDARQAARAERRAQAAAVEKAAADQQAEEAQHARLVDERVGAVFVCRNSSPDVVDEVLRVVGLDDQRWRQRVVVEVFTAPATTGEDDPVPRKVSMEWKTLIEPEAAQRHRTARLVLDSFDDREGWIRHERVSTHDWVR